MKKHIEEMAESRAMMEILTIKIRGEIQAAEYVMPDQYSLIKKTNLSPSCFADQN